MFMVEIEGLGCSLRRLKRVSMLASGCRKTPQLMALLVQKKALAGESLLMVIIVSVLPRLSNSWIIIIIWLYIALNRTPNIDCYWVGAVPKL